MRKETMYDILDAQVADDIYLTLKGPIESPSKSVMETIPMFNDVPGVVHFGKIDPEQIKKNLYWCKTNRSGIVLDVKEIQKIEASAVSCGSDSSLGINVFQVQPKDKNSSFYKWAVVEIYSYESNPVGLTLNWHASFKDAMSDYDKFLKIAQDRRARRTQDLALTN